MAPRPVRLVSAAALLAALALGSSAAATAAAVSTSSTPLQLIAAAERATLAARDVTISVREQVGGQPVTLSVSGRYPSYVRGVLLIANESEGVVVHGATTYFEANSPVWQASFKLSSNAAATMADRWFSTASTDPLLGGSTSSLNPKTIERSLFAAMRRISTLKGLTIRKTNVGGRAAIAIADKGGAIFIAAAGTPYLLRITSTTTTTTGYAQFSGYDAPITTQLPIATGGALDAAYAAAEASDAATTTTTAPAG